MLKSFYGKWVLVLSLATVLIAAAVSVIYASHRTADGEFFTFTGLTCNGDVPAVQNGFEKYDLTDPLGLLEGDWDVVNASEFRFSDTGAVLGLVGKITIQPGVGFYSVNVKGCNYTFDITGIAAGEDFVLTGPCTAKLNETTEYVPKLMDGSDVEEPDPVNSPAGLFTTTQSDFHVRRHDGGGYTDHRFGLNGDEVSSGNMGASNPDFSEFGNPVGFKFLDDGLYELEWVWRMPKPPDGMSAAEVNRATKKVVAGDYQEAMNTSGLSAADFQDELCPTPGSSCNLTAKIFEQLENEDLLAGVHCDGDGGFVFIQKNRDTYRKYTDRFAPGGSTSSDRDRYADMARECSQDHEKDHIDWLKDPINGYEDRCQGCCCVMAPTYDNDADCERGEQRAILEELVCLRNKWNAAPPGSKEKEFLTKYREHLRKFMRSGDICA